MAGRGGLPPWGRLRSPAAAREGAATCKSCACSPAAAARVPGRCCRSPRGSGAGGRSRAVRRVGAVRVGREGRTGALGRPSTVRRKVSQIPRLAAGSCGGRKGRRCTSASPCFSRGFFVVVVKENSLKNRFSFGKKPNNLCGSRKGCVKESR